MKKINWQKIWLITINVVLGIFIVVGLFLLVSFLPLKNNFKILAVTSGSMEPAISVGSVVVVQPSNIYRVGDIISYNSGIAKKDNTTHRIVEVKGKNGSRMFVTKGDANKGNDTKETPVSKVLGKKVFQVPLLGYFLIYIKTLPGLILIIVIPATIIIYDEATKIKNETKAMFKKRREAKNAK